MSNLVANISTDYPETSEFVKNKNPYYLMLIETVHKFGPGMWTRFLKMLYDTTEEIKDIINKGV